jgi:hypothetical protein
MKVIERLAEVTRFSPVHDACACHLSHHFLMAPVSGLVVIHSLTGSWAFTFSGMAESKVGRFLQIDEF